MSFWEKLAKMRPPGGAGGADGDGRGRGGRGGQVSPQRGAQLMSSDDADNNSPRYPPPPTQSIVDYMKTIYLFENGNEFTAPKRFTVNTRKTKSWDAFLQQVTDFIKPRSGYVRSLHTPDGGSRVDSFRDLKARKAYVAVSTWEPFRATEHVSSYLDVEDVTPFIAGSKPKLPYTANVDLGDLDMTEIVRSARESTPRGGPEDGFGANDGLLIYCYLNGDPVTPALPVLLRPIDLADMQIVLMRVTERLRVDARLGRPLRRLYTLRGDRIFDPSELESSEDYVAGPLEYFKKAPYGQRFPPLATSQTVDRKKVKQLGYLSLSSVLQETQEEEDVHQSRPRVREERRQERRYRSETPQSDRMIASQAKRSRSEDRVGPRLRAREQPRSRSRQGARSRSGSGSRSRSRSSSRGGRSSRNGRSNPKQARRDQRGGIDRDRQRRGDTRLKTAKTRTGQSSSLNRFGPPGRGPNKGGSRSPAKRRPRSVGSNYSNSRSRSRSRSGSRSGSRSRSRSESRSRGDLRGSKRNNRSPRTRGGNRSNAAGVPLDRRTRLPPIRRDSPMDPYRSSPPRNGPQPQPRDRRLPQLDAPRGRGPPPQDPRGRGPPPQQYDARGRGPPPPTQDARGRGPPPQQYEARGRGPPPPPQDARGRGPPPQQYDDRRRGPLPPPPPQADARGRGPPPPQFGPPQSQQFDNRGRAPPSSPQYDAPRGQRSPSPNKADAPRGRQPAPTQGDAPRGRQTLSPTRADASRGRSGPSGSYQQADNLRSKTFVIDKSANSQPRKRKKVVRFQ